MKRQTFLSFIFILISFLIIQCEREKLTDVTVTPGPIITNPEFNANETGILERELYNLVNQYREVNNLSPLIWSNTSRWRWPDCSTAGRFWVAWRWPMVSRCGPP